MKKHITLFLFLCTIVSAECQEEKDIRATALIKKSKKVYSKLTSSKIEFTKTLTNGDSLIEKESGTVWMKGDKFRVTLGDIEISTDGKKRWTIIHEDKEVTVSDFDEDEEDLPTPATILDKYKDDYKYTLIAQKLSVGTKKCHVIDFEPDVTKDKLDRIQVRKIRVFIDESTNQIVRWVMSERDGNTYTYDINELIKNPTVDDSFFVVDVDAIRKKGCRED